MLREDAPTNSVGTGKETSLPPSSEPGKKLRKKKLSDVKSMLDIKLESRQQQWPFLIELPGIGNFIMSGSSPLEVKFNLRKIVQPPIADTKIKITRLNQGEAIKYYMRRTNKSMKGIYEETMDIQEQMTNQIQPSGQAEKRVSAQNAQKTKQLQQQKAQMQKQIASKEMNAQKTAMQNTLKAKMDDMKKRQQQQAATQKKLGTPSV